MSRPPQLEPAWLIGLLMAWSRRTSRDTGLGYPQECIYLKAQIARGASWGSAEPIGYGGAEIDALEQHIHRLRLMRKLAVMRYARPWMVKAIDNEMGKTYDTDTWLYHLKGALAELAESMDRKKGLTHAAVAVINPEVV